MDAQTELTQILKFNNDFKVVIIKTTQKRMTNILETNGKSFRKEIEYITKNQVEIF